MFSPAHLAKYLPLAVGFVILAIIILLAPWNEIKKLVYDVPPVVFVALLGLSLLYFSSKAIRFWYILRLLDIRVPLGHVSLLYLSGQPFSILPAGEMYRCYLLKKHMGIRMSKSSPSVTIQGLVEAIVLLSLSVIGAFIIGHNRVAVGIIGTLLIILIVALQRGWFAKSYSLVNKVPFFTINKSKFDSFIQSHRDLLAPRSLTTLVAFSLIPVFSGVSIVYISSIAIGFDINYVQSIIVYSLPVIVSGLTFIPGGLGVSEGGAIGMLQLFGASAAAAITIALLLRIFTLVLGLVYGVASQLIIHFKEKVS